MLWFPLLNKLICAPLGPFQYQLHSLYDVDISSSKLEEFLYQKCHIPIGNTILTAFLSWKSLVYTFFNLHEHENWFLESKKSACVVAKLFSLPQAKISRFLPRGTDCSGYKIFEISCAWYIFNFPFIHLNVKEERGF